jgi:hypothetical protein
MGTQYTDILIYQHTQTITMRRSQVYKDPIFTVK